jgi:hypothetical protein
LLWNSFAGESSRLSNLHGYNHFGLGVNVQGELSRG